MKISEDKIVFTLYNIGEKAHIVLNDDKCNYSCKERYCTFICPAGCFEYDDDQKKIVFSFEGCLECGSCRVACEKDAIDWSHPEGGYGVIYRLS